MENGGKRSKWLMQPQDQGPTLLHMYTLHTYTNVWGFDNVSVSAILVFCFPCRQSCNLGSNNFFYIYIFYLIPIHLFKLPKDSFFYIPVPQ